MIGVLPGEGVGPEVVDVALRVLEELPSAGGGRFQVRLGGMIGSAAEERHGTALTEEVEGFCRETFAAGGAILHGPGGGRFVYDLRRRFDLFCKFSPLRVWPELAGDTRLRAEHVRGVDILLVRDNAGGIYQGQWSEETDPVRGRRAEQWFSYSEGDVRRILAVAARLAATRRGEMTVVIKDGGVPSISSLWRDCAVEEAGTSGVGLRCVNADLAAYELVQNPRGFDVLVCPNLIGDILADLGGALLGSRGMTFSGNFASSGAAVYQTNHGAAYDLAGSDAANPAGQVLALAMLLRESFGMAGEADCIEAAVARVLREGWRTADLAGGEGSRIVGTRAMGERIAAAVAGA